MSSVVGRPMVQWAYYLIMGTGLTVAPGQTETDPKSFWTKGPRVIPGAKIEGQFLRLDPGAWRFRISQGVCLGAGTVSLLIGKTSQTLKLCLGELDTATDLTGISLTFEITEVTDICLSYEADTEGEGLAALYPVECYLEVL